METFRVRFPKALEHRSGLVSALAPGRRAHLKRKQLFFTALSEVNSLLGWFDAPSVGSVHLRPAKRGARVFVSNTNSNCARSILADRDHLRRRFNGYRESRRNCQSTALLVPLRVLEAYRSCRPCYPFNAAGRVFHPPMQRRRREGKGYVTGIVDRI